MGCLVGGKWRVVWTGIGIAVTIPQGRAWAYGQPPPDATQQAHRARRHSHSHGHKHGHTHVHTHALTLHRAARPIGASSRGVSGARDLIITADVLTRTGTCACMVRKHRAACLCQVIGVEQLLNALLNHGHEGVVLPFLLQLLVQRRDVAPQLRQRHAADLVGRSHQHILHTAFSIRPHHRGNTDAPWTRPCNHRHPHACPAQRQLAGLCNQHAPLHSVLLPMHAVVECCCTVHRGGALRRRADHVLTPHGSPGLSACLPWRARSRAMVCHPSSSNVAEAAVTFRRLGAQPVPAGTVCMGCL